MAEEVVLDHPDTVLPGQTGQQRILFLAGSCWCFFSPGATLRSAIGVD
jgi:hypothetical protein